MPAKKPPMPISDLSDKHLIKLYYRIWDSINKWAEGGRLYGIDLATLFVCKPKLAKLYIEVYEEGQRRGL